MANTYFPTLIAAAALASPASLAAQDNGIGAPELQDFSLPGTRTTPPAPVVTVTPPPPPAQRPAPERAPERRTPAPASTTQTPARSTAPAVTAPAPVSEAPAAQAEPAPVEATPAPASDVPPVQEIEPTAPPPVTPESATVDWRIWAAAGGAALLLLAGFLLLRRRRRHAQDLSEVEAEPVPVASSPPPAIAPRRPMGPRAQMEIDFRPERLVTSENQAVVHFELTIRNRGDATASNVQIEARLFNASGAEADDVRTFFAAPVEAGTSGMDVPSGRGVQFTSAVTIPRDQIRVVEMAGRPLFIPTVAVKLLHDGGDGEDPVRITRRYLVGIEPKEPSGKMGPFRMDIGPRIYRSIGQRAVAAA